LPTSSISHFEHSPPLFQFSSIFENKGLVFAVLRAKRKILEAYEEPALLAATQQMRFKRSGNQKVLYEPKRRA